MKEYKVLEFDYDTEATSELNKASQKGWTVKFFGPCPDDFNAAYGALLERDCKDVGLTATFGV